MITANTIQSIMTHVVITAASNETIKSVREKLIHNCIHHIPVVEKGKVIGIISQSDINKMEHHFTLFHNPQAEIENKQIFETILAKEIMSTAVIKIQNSEPILKAVELFLENIFHALPVINNKDQLVGIITPLDLIRFAYQTEDNDW